MYYTTHLCRKHTECAIFWSELAPAHYCHDTSNLSGQKNIDFMAKYMNAPNCLELRPIEKYWGNIKRDLRKKGVIGKNMNVSENSAARKVSQSSIQTLIADVWKKVRDFTKTKYFNLYLLYFRLLNIKINYFCYYLRISLIKYWILQLIFGCFIFWTGFKLIEYIRKWYTGSLVGMRIKISNDMLF